MLPGLFGYHIVLLGPLCPGADLLAASRIRHRIVAGEPGWGGEAGLWARPEALPLASDSVDAVVLAHTLEFAAAPHQVLREVERVLIPEGHVVVLGFHPWSPWGAAWLAGRRRGGPWGERLLSPVRVRDWLALLGFDVVAERRLLRRPPLPAEGLLLRLRWLERPMARLRPPAGAYLLVGRKRVLTLTPVRPRWRRRAVTVPGLIKPTARGMR